MSSLVPLSRSELLRVRLYSFLWLGAHGLVLPFMTLFYQHKGLSGVQIGFLATAAALATLVAAPFWGRLNDAWRDTRRVLFITLLGSAACYLLLIPADHFYLIAAAVLTQAFFNAGVWPLSDLLSAQVVQHHPTAGFGSVRMWGSLGWAISAPLSGWLIQRLDIEIMLWLYAALILGSVWALSRLTSRTEPVTHAPASSSLGSLLDTIRRDPLLVGMALAFGVVFLANIGRLQFEPAFLRTLGATTGVIGLVNTVGALVELPGLLWADRLVRRFGGGKTLGISWLATGVFLGLVLVFPVVPGYFVFRVFNGLAFSLYAVSTTLYLPGLAPAGQRGTMLALYTVTLRALLALVGGPLSGWIYDAAGAYWLYALGAVGYFLGWGILALAQRQRRSQPAAG